MENGSASAVGRGSQKHSQLFGIDLRSLALFRIGLGVVILGDTLDRLLNFRAFYTDSGVLPRAFLLEKSYSWPLSLNLLSGSASFQGFLFLALGVSSLMLIFGYRSRFATFLCWLLLTSVNARNPLIHQEGDILLRIYLFLGLFLPLGGWASVDRRRAQTPQRFPRQVLSGGTVALLFQTCLVYWFTALNRTGTAWQSGTALASVFHIDSLTAPLGASLLGYPRFLEFLTRFIFCLEIFGPLLVFTPYCTALFRSVVVFLMVGLHLGMVATLNLGPFPYISIVGWFAFLPGEFWEKATRTSSDKIASSPPLFLSGWFANLLPLLFLFNALLWNLCTVNARKFRIPLPAKLMALSGRLSFAQGWAMFGPDPEEKTGWFVIPGKLYDGSVIDVFREGKAVDWEKPQPISALAMNVRWRKYLDWIKLSGHAAYRPYYGRYLCLNWNSRHPPIQRLESLQIYWMQETTFPQAPESKTEKLLLWEGDCAEHEVIP